MSVESITPPRGAAADAGPFRALGRKLRALDWRPAISFAGIVALWFAAHEFNWVREKFLPSPVAVVERFWFEIHSGTILYDLAETLRRNIIGFAIGSFIGLALGALLGISGWVAKVVGPTVLAQRQTALFAWVPLLSVWFGGADVGKIAFIAVAAFQPVVINTWRGLALVPKTYRELSEALSFTRWDYVRLVAVPSALPTIFTGFHAALIYAWLATVGSELFLNIAPGLGGRLSEGSQLFEIDLLFLAIILFGLVGLFYNTLAERTEAIFLRWNSR